VFGIESVVVMMIASVAAILCDKNYHSIERLLINHLSNQIYDTECSILTRTLPTCWSYHKNKDVILEWSHTIFYLCPRAFLQCAYLSQKYACKKTLKRSASTTLNDGKRLVNIIKTQPSNIFLQGTKTKEAI
jgi:hypothetical protein